MINRNQHYESLAEEILSKDPESRLTFIKELQKRDQVFYDRMRHLADKTISDNSDIATSSESEIRRILKELKS